MSIVVLSAAMSKGAIVDGVTGAMVIASQAGCTPPGPSPYGASAFAATDVVHGADLDTTSTSCTSGGIHRERFVGNHPSAKHSPNYMSQHPGQRTATSPVKSFAAFGNILDNPVQLSFGDSQFLFFPLGCVGVHEGQDHIAFWHDEREDAVGGHALGGQHLVEDVHGLPDIVATSTQGIAVMPCDILREIHLPDEALDKGRWLPSVDRKAKSNPFTFSQGEHVNERFFIHLYQGFAKAFSQAASGPFCVSRTGKIKYHRNIFCLGPYSKLLD